MAHELWVARGGDTIPLKAPRHAAGPATHEQMEALFHDWEGALTAIQFFKKRDPELVMRGFRELIYRADPDGREATLFRAIGLEVGHYMRRAGLLPPRERDATPGTPAEAPGTAVDPAPSPDRP